MYHHPGKHQRLELLKQMIADKKQKLMANVCNPQIAACARVYTAMRVVRMRLSKTLQ